MKEKAAKPAFKKVAATTLVPKPFKPAGPKCVTVKPCPQTVSVPGQAYGVATIKATELVPTKVPVYRNLCEGKSKGKCQVGCDMAIKWEAKWLTKEKIGETKVPLPKEISKKVIVPVPPEKCDVVAACY